MEAVLIPNRPAALIGRAIVTSRRTWVTRLYVGAVIGAGSVLLLWFAPRHIDQSRLAGVLLGATLLLSMFKLRLPLPKSHSTMSMAFVVDFVALLMADVPLAMVLAAAGTLLQCTVRVRRAQPLHRTAFSVASVVIAVQAAGLMWHWLQGSASEPSLNRLALPLTAATLTYFLVNTVLVAAAVAVTTGVSAARAWHRDFFWSGPGYFLSAMVATMVALIVKNDAYILLPLTALPLYLSYRAYQMSVSRIDEERQHGEQSAKLFATAQQALVRAVASEKALAAEKDRLVLESSRLAVTMGAISDGVVTVDRTGGVVLMNESARRLASVTTDDYRACSVAQVFAAVGVPVPMYQSALQRVFADGQPVRLRSDVDGFNPLSGLMEITGTPTRDSDGHVAGSVWILRDVTDIARIEHERAKAARLESLGVLAGGLAHDFNNILTGVVGNLSLAESLVRPEDNALSARLTSAAAACTRARAVTNQLLTFAKGGAPVKTQASVDELVVECTRFALSGSAVAPRFSLDEALWPADIDTGQISQVVHNLVLNAMQAMPRGGVVDVSLRNVNVEEDSPAASAVKPGRYVALTVRDGGGGIRRDQLGRIFDPYFTTKEKGSGLGLAISYSIIRAHGGSITVDSEIGVGATFTVFLPASSRSLAMPVATAANVTASGRGRVLLMDDDACVADVVQDMLDSLGYTVEVAVSGHDAIEKFARAEALNDPFDITILDLTVPGGMGGAEAITHIRRINEDVTAFVSSGYADGSVLAKFRDYGFDGVLPKPFTVVELREALGTVTRNHEQERRIASVSDAIAYEGAPVHLLAQRASDASATMTY